DERAEHGGEAVGEQRLPHARQVAVRIEQTRAVGDADQRTGVVEHVDHQKAEYDDDEGQFRDAGEIELQEGRRERGRRRHDAREFGKPERQADQRHREDADQRGADDVAVIERDDHDETGETENRRPLLEIAERDQRRRVGDDDLGFLEGDDAEKEPDAGGANLRFFGIELMMYSRILKTEMRKNRTPEQNTPASACCQVYLWASTTVKAKNASSPMPGASAIG